MADAGIDCSDLIIQDPGESGSADTILGAGRQAPEAVEVGFCNLPGAPEVGGVLISTRILVFEDEAHLESLPDPHFLPGQVLVYGDTWEVYVIPASEGTDVRDALGGKMIRGLGDFPLDEDASRVSAE